MPAERGLRRVFGNHRVIEAGGRDAGPFGNPPSQPLQKRRYRRRRVQFVARKIITAAVGDDPAAGAPFLVVGFFEGQCANDVQQLAFLGRCQEVRLVPQPLGRRGGNRKQDFLSQRALLSAPASKNLPAGPPRRNRANGPVRAGSAPGKGARGGHQRFSESAGLDGPGHRQPVGDQTHLCLRDGQGNEPAGQASRRRPSQPAGFVL